MDKKIIVAVIAIITIIIVGLGYVNYNGTEFGSSMQVTGLAGRTVSVPANVTHVAALVGPSFEKMILLNQTSKISVMMPVSNGSSPVEDSLPWAYKVAPELKNVQLWLLIRTLTLKNF